MVWGDTLHSVCQLQGHITEGQGAEAEGIFCGLLETTYNRHLKGYLDSLLTFYRKFYPVLIIVKRRQENSIHKKRDSFIHLRDEICK